MSQAGEAQVLKQTMALFKPALRLIAGLHSDHCQS